MSGNFAINKLPVDADSLIYMAGFAVEAKDSHPTERTAIACLNKIMQTQFRWLGPRLGQNFVDEQGYYLDDFKKWIRDGKIKFYLTSTDKSNFRFKLYDDYKATRKNKPKPIHYTALREWLIEEWNAEVVYGMEADDKIGIELGKDPQHTLAWHKDKDINQVAGWHGWYDAKDKHPKKPYYVEFPGTFQLVKSASGKLELDCTGDYLLMYQLLAGDRADNIPSLGKGWGPMKCYEFMKKLREVKPWSWLATIQAEYHKAGLDTFDIIYKLVYIKRYECQLNYEAVAR